MGQKYFKSYNLCVLYFLLLKDTNDDLEEESATDSTAADTSIDENGKQGEINSVLFRVFYCESGFIKFSCSSTIFHLKFVLSIQFLWKQTFIKD